MASLSDNFNRSDDPDDLGANWTTDDGELNISSNTAVGVSGAGGICGGRYTGTALDSSDHKTTVDIDYISDQGGYGIARRASATRSFYWSWFQGPWGGTNSWSIGKTVSGSKTVLDNGTDQGWPDPSTCMVSCDGTSITGTINGGDSLSATDSAVSSGTYGGIETNYETQAAFDDWAAEDLAAAATGKANPLGGPLAGPLAGPIGL